MSISWASIIFYVMGYIFLFSFFLPLKLSFFEVHNLDQKMWLNKYIHSARAIPILR